MRRTSLCLLLALLSAMGWAWAQSQVTYSPSASVPARPLGASPSSEAFPAPPPDPLWDGLVGYWTLDETSGTRADSLGAYPLTDTGSVGYITGQDGNAGNFTTTNYLTSGTFSPTLGQTDAGVTWAFWFRRTSNPSGFACAVGSSLASNPPFQLRFNSSCQPAPFIRDSVGSIYAVGAAGTSLCDDSWYLLIVVWNEGHDKTLRAYVPQRAFSASSPASTFELLYNNAGGVSVGRDGAGSYLWARDSPATAAVDALAIWSRAISSAERAKLYAGAGKFP